MRKTLPTRGKILEHWKTWLEQEEINLLHPCCWACGRNWHTAPPLKEENPSWNQIKTVWDIQQLERCHIRPQSLGGSNEPSNLFLMCRECHDRAPDVASREYFFLWVNRQSQIKRRTEQLKEAWAVFVNGPFDEEAAKGLLWVMNQEGFWEWVTANSTSHFDPRVGGPILKMTTFIAAILLYIQEHAEDLRAQDCTSYVIEDIISDHLCFKNIRSELIIRRTGDKSETYIDKFVQGILPFLVDHQ
jgi:hypothetical protein